MEKQIITFTANEQSLVRTSGECHYSSNKVSYIEARFDLGQNWSFESVRAVWFTDFNGGVSTVLDTEGICIVPMEVLKRKAKVYVNLVGSDVSDDIVTDRLTTYPILACIVDANARINGSLPAEATPSQVEQFANAVKADADRAETAKEGARVYAGNALSSAQNALVSETNASASEDNAKASELNAEAYKNQAQTYAQNADISATSAENAKDEAEDARDTILGMRAEATTLPEGSSATASYNDGVMSFGIPKGDTGATGATGETGATPQLSIGTVTTTTEPSVTITGTAENPVLNFGLVKGDKGDTGEVSLEDLESLLPTETASGEIVTITDGQAVVPAKSLKVQLEPIQAGSGEPSPSNVRPISGRTEVVTIVSPTTSASDGTTYTTALGRTVYGGTLDVVSGELVVDRASVDMETLNWSMNNTEAKIYQCNPPNMKRVVEPPYESRQTGAICSIYSASSNFAISLQMDDKSWLRTGNQFFVRDTSYDSASSFKAAMNGVQLVYELATPQTIQLTPQQIDLLLGTNHLWSDGEVTLVYSADIQKWVEKQLGTRTTLTMSRPMVQTETEETKTAETETETTETETE